MRRIIPAHALLVTAVLAAPFVCAWTARAVPVTVVGTTDLHGRVERTAAVLGHVNLLRANAKRDGGAVVLVDAGDMFQGTMESNLVEGQTVVTAYNALGYDGVAVGNHEFDFGPAGPLATPKTPSDDPQGALKLRAREAKYPFLAANILDEKTKAPVTWPNVKPSVLVEKKAGKAKIKVGIIGLTTEDTKKTTSSLNTAGVIIAPLRDAVLREADALRKRGADLVVVTAHAGAKCSDMSNPDDASSCEQDAEIVKLAKELPQGLVDVIVAGHTHSEMAHVVNGIPIVIGWSNGRGFSRVDFDVDPKTHKATRLKVHRPRAVCADEKVDIEACAPPEYEGQKVEVDAALLKQLGPFIKEARKMRDKHLGVTIVNGVKRAYSEESALGNLFADVMRDSATDVFKEPVDVAIMNGGGIREDLPAGALTYGAVFLMMPFDNRYALMHLKGSELKAMLASNLSFRKGGIFSVSGVKVDITCEGSKASVEITRPNGKRVADDEPITLATTDFLATGGDGALDGVKARKDGIVMDEGDPVREHMARAFTKRGGTIDGKSAQLFDAKARRLRVVGAPDASRCKKE
jgi:5'-nucleotidase